nr:DNA helicase [Tanacetum cinerariifolium]
MGVPKKVNVGTRATFDDASNHLHGEGSSSDTYGNLQTPSPIDIHMYDARGYLPITTPTVQMDTSTKHISTCTRPNAQNTSEGSLLSMTIDTLTSKQNYNPTPTKEVMAPIIDNNDVSYTRMPNYADDTHTTASASNTNSTNNANMTTAREPGQQQSMRRRHRTLSNKFLTVRQCAVASAHALLLASVIGTCRYDLPTPETIRAIIFGGRTAMESEFDLIVEEHSQGYHKDMKLVNVPGHSGNNQKRMSMNMYYAYQIHDRLNHYSLPRRGKLFQQYVVTAYCAVEQSRLDYIRQNQNDIRNEYLSGIYDAIIRGDRDGNDLGTRTMLTASFTGGPRYMYAHYLDALVICRVHGNPSFFITFTCNAKWPEIQDYMASRPELTTADRADIVDRIFEQKVRDYVKTVFDNMSSLSAFETLVPSILVLELCLIDGRVPICASFSLLNFLWIKSYCILFLKDLPVVQIPDELCVPDGDTAIRELINFIYDNQTFERPTAKDLQKKVIVCPKNEIADTINTHVLSLLNQDQCVYLSSDEATPHGNGGGETELLYPNEYLNTLKFACYHLIDLN